MESRASRRPRCLFLRLLFILAATLVIAIFMIPSVAAQHKQPASFTFYLHNTVLDTIRFNNTNYFNSVFTVLPTGFSNPWQFGTVATFEDPLTVAASNTSEQLGIAQGFYMYDSQTSFVLFQAFTANINTTEYQGTIDIFGQMKESLSVRYLSVIGGTGDFFLARGVASCELTELVTTGGPTRWTLYFELDLYY